MKEEHEDEMMLASADCRALCANSQYELTMAVS
jgi:hypothetical protein